MTPTDDIEHCISVLKRLNDNNALLADLPTSTRELLMEAAGRLSRPSRLEQRQRNRHIDRARRQQVLKSDRQTMNQSGIREARQAPVFTPPPQLEGQRQEPTPRRLHKPRHCYVCKAEYTELHFFYDSMCPKCAVFNYQKRFQTASLEGQVALITGARLKIGQQAALMMLRAGAQVIVTTRFPVDAALRYARESDFAKWRHRLEIHGLDLRHTPSVEIFAKALERRCSRLDILINNAAQTVRRPPGFYAHLLPTENTPHGELPIEVRELLQAHIECKHLLQIIDADGSEQHLPVTWNGHAPGIGIRASAQLSQIPYAYDGSLCASEVFPEGRLDADLQQVDLREINSWRLSLSEVSAPEMLEVQLVNAVAPFVLCSRLAPLMRKNPTGNKHIVNVTAMEGKFTRFTKTDKHPHTNMAKAALNMLTHTSARDLVKDGIHMNAVDTGWVTDEDPAALSQRKQEDHGFQPPLDIVDGAARVCDPFFDGLLTGRHWWGKFLKDYFPTDW